MKRADRLPRETVPRRSPDPAAAAGSTLVSGRLDARLRRESSHLLARPRETVARRQLDAA
jgi:hypothetical protein